MSDFESILTSNDSNAMYNLGHIYEHGVGVQQDYSKAKQLYEKAIELENSNAMNNLGYMYFIGKGVQKDYNKAKQLYEKAIELGNSNAMNNLGYMYEHGPGVQQDYNKAKQLFEKAIELGNSMAMYNLGCMYRNGRGVQQDYNKALRLYIQYYILTQDNIILNVIDENRELQRSMLNMCTEYIQLQEQHKKLQQDYERLKLEVLYQPDGPGYEEAKKEFESFLTAEHTNI